MQDLQLLLAERPGALAFALFAAGVLLVAGALFGSEMRLIRPSADAPAQITGAPINPPPRMPAAR